MLRCIRNQASPLLVAYLSIQLLQIYSVTGSGRGVISEEPQKLTYSYSALCAIAKNENRYVLEWASYHKCIGMPIVAAGCRHACMLAEPPKQET
jgi:hypothetical protein